MGEETAEKIRPLIASFSLSLEEKEPVELYVQNIQRSEND